VVRVLSIRVLGYWVLVDFAQPSEEKTESLKKCKEGLKKLKA